MKFLKIIIFLEKLIFVIKKTKSKKNKKNFEKIN